MGPFNCQTPTNGSREKRHGHGMAGWRTAWHGTVKTRALGRGQCYFEPPEETVLQCCLCISLAVQTQYKDSVQEMACATSGAPAAKHRGSEARQEPLQRGDRSLRRRQKLKVKSKVWAHHSSGRPFPCTRTHRRCHTSKSRNDQSKSSAKDVASNQTKKTTSSHPEPRSLVSTSRSDIRWRRAAEPIQIISEGLSATESGFCLGVVSVRKQSWKWSSQPGRGGQHHPNLKSASWNCEPPSRSPKGPRIIANCPTSLNSTKDCTWLRPGTPERRPAGQQASRPRGPSYLCWKGALLARGIDLRKTLLPGALVNLGGFDSDDRASQLKARPDAAACLW